MSKRLIAFLQNHKYFGIHGYALVALSALMLFIIQNFKINDFYAIPQFDEWDYFAKFLAEIQSANKQGWYRSFFIVDAFWAFTLLTFLYRILHRLSTAPRYGGFSGIGGFVVVIILAYASDLAEGFCYFFKYKTPLEVLVKIKIGLYVLTGVWFLYGLLHFWYAPDKLSWVRRNYFAKSIKVFFSTSYLSLVLVVVLILLGSLPQGYTMVVDLLAKPGNLVVVFFLLFLISVVASHYPAYFESRKFVDPASLDWNIWPSKKRLPFGIIYYDKAKRVAIGKLSRYRWVLSRYSQGFSELTKLLRHHLGTAIFVAFLYVLGYAAESIFDGYWFTRRWAWTVLIFAIWFYEQLKKRPPKQQVRVFKISAGVSLLLIGISAFFSSKGWSSSILFWTIITIIPLLLTYLSFRLVRRKIMNDFTIRKGVKYPSTRKLVSFIAVFSFISLVWLVIINLHLEWAEKHTSSITVVLLYGLHYYGFVVLLSKLSQLYGEKGFTKRRWAGFFRIVPRVFVPLLLIYSFLLPKYVKNKLHYLEQRIEMKDDVLSLKKYTKKFKKHNGDGRPIMLTSYGGGLMADLWAMLVVQELQETTSGQLLKQAFNMSGNSGGGIGFGNYTNLVMHTEDSIRHPIWDKRIESVGNFNHLSLDLTFLLGRDMMRKLIPVATDSTVDRNAYAMRRYSQLTGDTCNKSFDKTFREYWNEVYQKQDGQFPSLTISTATVQDGGFANAFSLKTEDHGSVFHGIENILDVDSIQGDPSNKSLIYYDALSTTNRFPILSSAASIHGLGQYIDGGAYDNSGLLNSIELARTIQKTDTLKPCFITISNDTGSYLNWLFGTWKDGVVDETLLGEINALIKGGIVIDRVSEHLEDELDDFAQCDRVEIFLPRIISFEQVIDYLGGKPPKLLDTIMKRVEISNDSIYSALRRDTTYLYEEWGTVQAPLARLLSEPAKRYEYAMLRYHPEVLAQLEKAKDLVSSCSEREE